ncbi:DUF3566 domain-containing protein [Actinokineospora iranica]|uniref:DUF3566 domain-containing protein n=1 Tax=Actinokineospora iranica TaxID=1271860 RepID=A0A1G6PIH8_9PSEU|nr:DUF3566 domain-containing protein [Actinokineospora iranica]SDC79963.1 Transmembrane protein of unknown function [Actinokineospora iranica]
MTPPEKPDTTGPEPEHTSERTSVVATSGKLDPPGQEPQPSTGSAKNDSAENTSAKNTSAEDTTAENDAAPPPWQRVADSEAADTAAAQPKGPDADTTQSIPTAGNGFDPAAYRPVDETTVSVERPVVTGTAAGRVFGDHAPPRAAVNLDSGGLRAGTQNPPSARRPGRGPRRANLQIRRFDPWSVLKLSLVLGVALFFVWLVAVGALYAVLDGMGVWDKLNGISSELLNTTDGTTSGPLISAGRVFGIAAIIGAINIVLFSALATVGAFVYNVSADLAGGLEVTLAERE